MPPKGPILPSPRASRGTPARPRRAARGQRRVAINQRGTTGGDVPCWLTRRKSRAASALGKPRLLNPGQRQRRQVGVGMEHSSSGDSRSAASWPSGGEVTMRTEAGRFCIRAGPAPLAPQNRPNRLREVKPSSASSSQRRATRYGKVLQPQDVSLRWSGSMAPTLLATARGAPPLANHRSGRPRPKLGKEQPNRFTHAKSARELRGSGRRRIFSWGSVAPP